ncbi:hypothetical protein BgAZ_207520 [Babesia gibsoni]|uniref:Uncharacterized protein n=1 Tax=Babesia gibsoni TaxID=33632 RepID=A0AAD8US10_BABGI|nr:hypothetical protein BgAZ_207520 [Babesia gibsoni]
MKEVGCPLHPGSKSYFSEVEVEELKKQRSKLLQDSKNSDSMAADMDETDVETVDETENLSKNEVTTTMGYVDTALPDPSGEEKISSSETKDIAQSMNMKEIGEAWQRQWSLNHLMERDDTASDAYKVDTDEGEKVTAEHTLLGFKLERANRVISVLKKQLEERDESISRMLTHVSMLEEWKDGLGDDRKLLAIEHEKELESIMAVMNEKYARKKEECQTLKSKLLAMEQDHMLKDNDLRCMQLEVTELKSKNAKLEYKIEAMEADKGLVAKSIERLKASFKERELKMRMLIDKEYQEQGILLTEELEVAKMKIAAKEKELRNCAHIIHLAEQECSKLVSATIGLKKLVNQKDEQIKRLANEILDLEETLVRNDQDSSTRINATLAMLDGLKREKLELKSNNRELKHEIVRYRGIECAKR